MDYQQDSKVATASNMDDDTAKVGAQKIDHESSKEHVAPDLEEKTADISGPHASPPESQHAATESGTKQKDMEKVETVVQTPEPVKVPRAQQRGLFGRFSILAEVEEPKHYSRRVKWYITFIVALTGAAAPMGSAVIFRMTPDAVTAALANNA